MTDQSLAQRGLDAAINAAGGVVELANALKVAPSTVSHWRLRDGVPPFRVPAVSRLFGISPETLRPDLFKGTETGKSPDSRSEVGEYQTPFVQEARALGLDPEAIAAAALKKAIGDEKARRWAEENREAIAAHHRYVEEHGLPLAKYRMF